MKDPSFYFEIDDLSFYLSKDWGLSICNAYLNDGDFSLLFR